MQKTISTLDFFDTELKGTIFMTRLTKYEKETIILTPALFGDVLEYEGKFYNERSLRCTEYGTVLCVPCITDK